MPRVTRSQVESLKKLRDEFDAYSNYGTVEAVERYYSRLPLLKVMMIHRINIARGEFLSTYHFLKFVKRGWLRCVESSSHRPKLTQFMWRLTEAGKRACWHKNPADGTPEDKVIEVDDE